MGFFCGCHRRALVTSCSDVCLCPHHDSCCICCLCHRGGPRLFSSPDDRQICDHPGLCLCCRRSGGGVCVSGILICGLCLLLAILTYVWCSCLYCRQTPCGYNHCGPFYARWICYGIFFAVCILLRSDLTGRSCGNAPFLSWRRGGLTWISRSGGISCSIRY